jgi:cysteine sulfinate desulfinase/cysteine desulfurase-like protein
MRYTPQETSRVLRFSSGWQTTKMDWDSLLEGLERVEQERTKRRR